MSVKARLLIILCMVCFFTSLCGQQAVVVSEPVLSLKNGKVHIEFQLLNTSRSETFTVRAVITDQGGNSIQAKSLSGDLGKGVSGGGNKRIIWDIEADSMFLDEDIFVEVYALPETQAIAVIPPEEDVREEEAREESNSGKELNRTSLIAQSIAFPGLGLSRLNPGSPHWLRGVAGYGCLAGSIYFNRRAWSNYQDYLGSESPSNVEDLFDKTYNEKKTSGILAYTALGIWVLDLAWTIIGTSGMNSDQLSMKQKRLSIGTTLEPVSNIPLIALFYKF